MKQEAIRSRQQQQRKLEGLDDAQDRRKDHATEVSMHIMHACRMMIFVAVLGRAGALYTNAIEI